MVMSWREFECQAYMNMAELKTKCEMLEAENKRLREEHSRLLKLLESALEKHLVGEVKENDK